jgi:hypothetical protein
MSGLEHVAARYRGVAGRGAFLVDGEELRLADALLQRRAVGVDGERQARTEDRLNIGIAGEQLMRGDAFQNCRAVSSRGTVFRCPEAKASRTSRLVAIDGGGRARWDAARLCGTVARGLRQERRRLSLGAADRRELRVRQLALYEGRAEPTLHPLLTEFSA